MVMSSNVTINGLNPDLPILGSEQEVLYDNTDSWIALSAHSQFTPLVGTPSVANIQLKNKQLAGYRFKHTSSTTDTNTYGKLEFQYYVNAADTSGTTVWQYTQNSLLINMGGSLALTLNSTAAIFTKPMYARGVSGLMYFSANATATTTMDANTWLKVLGTTTLAATGSEITMPANNRLTFTTSDPSNPVPTVFITANLVFKNAGAASAANIAFGIYKNGATLIAPISNTTMAASATNLSPVSFRVMTTATSSDYFELWAMSSVINTPGIIVTDGSISIESA